MYHTSTQEFKKISVEDILTKKWGLIVGSSVNSTFIKGTANALTK